MKLTKKDINKIKKWRKRFDGDRWCPFSTVESRKTEEYEKCLICWYIFPEIEFNSYGCKCPCTLNLWDRFSFKQHLSVREEVDKFLTEHKKKYGY